ncbi:MAG TPA: DUF3971 domain-containing protein [Azospirillaceae bacterium]|nr:DUF3971 domain-containing protein [Azospirillaceae bacterium]
MMRFPAVRRTLILALEVLAAVVAGIVVLAGLLIWRLQQGPISLDFLGPYLEAALERENEGQGMRISVGELVLTWGGWSRPLEVRAKRIAADTGQTGGQGGGRLVMVPEMGINLDMQSLLLGTVSPTELELVRPLIYLTRLENGSLVLDVRPTAAAADQGPSFGDALVKALLGRPDPSLPFGRLSQVSIVEGELVVDDLRAGFTWEAARADITLVREAGGLSLDGGLTVLLGAGATTLVVDGRYNFDDGRIRFSMKAGAISLRDLVAVAPELGPIGRLNWTVNGEVEVDFDRAFQLVGARAGVERADGSGRLVAALGAPEADGGRRLEAWVERIPLPSLAPLLTDGDVLAGADIVVDGNAQVRLGPDDTPGTGRVTLRGGQGRIAFPGMGPDPVEIGSFLLDAGVNVPAGRLDLERLEIDLGGPRISADGWVVHVPAEDRVDWLLAAAVRGLPVADLRRRWPEQAAPGAREWVVENLEDGVVDAAQATVSGSLPLSGAIAPRIDGLDGTIDFRGVTVHYYRPLPPVTGVDGTARFDLDAFEIKTAPAKLGELAVGEARIRLQGLRDESETALITVPVTGPLPVAMAVIDHEPLRLARRFEMPPSRISGTFDATLDFNIPLRLDLEVEDMGLKVAAKVNNARIKEVAPDIDATDGRFDLSLDLHRMELRGPVRLNGVPVTAAWNEVFSGKEAGRRLELRGNLDEEARRRLDLPLLPMVMGPVPVRADISSAGKGQERLVAEMDLARATVSLPEIAWSKKPGEPGSARVEMLLAKQGVAAIPVVRVRGPGLRAEASIAFRKGGGEIERVDIREFAVGETRLQVEAARKNPGWRVRATGAVLDLRPILEAEEPDDGKGRPPPQDKDRTPVEMDVEFGRVVLGEDRELSSVVGSLDTVGKALRRADVAASAGDARLLFRYSPEGDGGRFQLETGDFGRALDGLNVDDRVRGGRLVVSGRHVRGQPDVWLAGRIEADQFHVVQMPFLARLFNGLSLSGLNDLLGSDGVSFNRLVGDFLWNDQGVHLEKGRAWGGSIGLTAEGRVDPDAWTGQLTGTIVPLYGINRVIGAIPLLGDLITGGEGQGILAANWRLNGHLADPDVSVNPLSLLAPGFLRRLFFPNVSGRSEPPPPNDNPGPQND